MWQILVHILKAFVATQSIFYAGWDHAQSLIPWYRNPIGFLFWMPVHPAVRAVEVR
jgi:hypothetical protein